MDYRLLGSGLKRALTPAVAVLIAVAALFGRNVSAQAPIPSTRADSFPHARHAAVACLECHDVGSGHGRLRFARPDGCRACHHQQANQTKCLSCHVKDDVLSPKPETVTVTVAGHASKPRPVKFLHEPHIAAKQCVECHTTPSTLLPPPSKTQCQDCHADHHTAGRNCSGCHVLADPKVAHSPFQATHQQCDACHTATTVARLTPTRSLCSTCHADKAKNHNDSKECTVCHFLSEPTAYRAKLTTPH